VLDHGPSWLQSAATFSPHRAGTSASMTDQRAGWIFALGIAGMLELAARNAVVTERAHTVLHPIAMRWIVFGVVAACSAPSTGVQDAAVPRDAEGAPLDASADASFTVPDATSSDAPADASSMVADASGSMRDVFGIEQLYPTRAGGAEWSSAYWQDGTRVLANGDRDPGDPLGLAGARGTGMLSRTDGVMTMSGAQPRLYIYEPSSAAWTNVEITLYYRRQDDANTPYAGIVVGARSGADGHTSAGACDAHTYYSRLRNDGTADFEKELEHPGSSPREVATAEALWPGQPAEIPRGSWIGWKYVIRNRGNDVLLEAYRDLSEGRDGGEWSLVGRSVDAGDWSAPSTCASQGAAGGTSTWVQREGGVILVRNTNVMDVEYRALTIREIDPAS
jgi:hypothetical protein